MGGKGGDGNGAETCCAGMHQGAPNTLLCPKILITLSWNPCHPVLQSLFPCPWGTPCHPVPVPSAVVESEDSAEEPERRARGCRPQFQRTRLRVLAHFVAHPLDGGRHLSYLPGPEWLLDVTHLVAARTRVQDPRVASLEAGAVVVGREPGVTSVEVNGGCLWGIWGILGRFGGGGCGKLAGMQLGKMIPVGAGHDTGRERTEGLAQDGKRKQWP